MAQLLPLAKHDKQGDQVGLIFAYWLGDCLCTVDNFHKITKVAQKFVLHFSTVKVMYYFWIKSELGYILGDFFTHSSGHPDWQARWSN
jgi:hypothetical protein